MISVRKVTKRYKDRVAVQDLTFDVIAAALTRTQNAVVFGGYAVVALALGTTLLYRRDPS